jgi:hypothetical protein
MKVVPSENKIILHNGNELRPPCFATGAETSYFGMENVKKKRYSNEERSMMPSRCVTQY